MIASRNYLDDHILGRMAGNQRAKALQGLFDGRSLAMGYITQGKKKQQKPYVYEPWAQVVRWLFERFRELDNFGQLCREVENMPYLFPDPSTDDLLRYTFKIHMRKVPGGFRPSSVESLKYILTNPMYIGAWVYKDAVVIEDNHEPIVDRDLFLWSYHKLTCRDLQGEPLNGVEPRRLRPNAADAVLKYILRSPEGLFYVMRPRHPEYIRQSFRLNAFQSRRLQRDVMFAIRAKLIDDIFLDRLKELAWGDAHLAQHVEASLTELQQEHSEAVISVEEHLALVRKEMEKTVALLHDQTLDLTPYEKAKYNKLLQGLREREQELLRAQERSTQATLQADLDELRDVLADIPTLLDSCSMERKQKLVRLLTESVVLEELSVHWLRLTVVWRGPLTDQPDVCLIWRQRGRRNQPWTIEEDATVREYYPNSDKWTALRALPHRSWNVIGQRATQLGVRRTPYLYEKMPENFAIEDLAVFPDQDFAFKLIVELSDPHSEGKQNVYPIWLYSASTRELVQEITGRDIDLIDWPISTR
jgi:recombinase